jgi:1,2-diacylglycerol 3-beta-galactosyltransferase
MVKADFVYFDAGGGHRSAANALKAVVEEQGRPWSVNLLNLQDVLDPLDIFRKYTGVALQDIYNRMLANGWTLGSGYLLPGMHGLIRMYLPAQVRMLAAWWKQNPPDMVVSVVPNFNRALYQGLRRVSPRAPYVTILTDLADYPPHFWIERQDLRHGPGGRAGPETGLFTRSHLPHLGHDSAARVLPHFRARPCGGKTKARPRPAQTDRSRSLWRPGLAAHAANRRASRRARRGCAVDPDLRAQ